MHPLNLKKANPQLEDAKSGVSQLMKGTNDAKNGIGDLSKALSDIQKRHFLRGRWRRQNKKTTYRG
ncbi:hypothetical protein RWE15_17950 [Virgibacillus halophilus]|uniref:Uncharacterized protein n=1 Tax=Tigheibacillus halophilus TaxID=361280 RepID=A0ABU5CA55_9BACI|nr:hypothetical protein [Virgibacillus halophilus]